MTSIAQEAFNGCTAEKATLTRSLTTGRKSTVMLPFAVSDATKLGTVYEYNGEKDEVDGTVHFDEVESTEASKAYIMVPTVTQIVAENVEVVPTTSYTVPETGLIGVYEKKVLTGDELISIYYWSASDGVFSQATESLTVGATRAYLKPQGAKLGARLAAVFEGETTGISNVKMQASLLAGSMSETNARSEENGVAGSRGCWFEDE